MLEVWLFRHVRSRPRRESLTSAAKEAAEDAIVAALETTAEAKAEAAEAKAAEASAARGRGARRADEATPVHPVGHECGRADQSP